MAAVAFRPVELISHRWEQTDKGFLLVVGGQTFRVDFNALKSYVREYGLEALGPVSVDDCLDHIALELETALGVTPRQVGSKGRLERRDTGTLIFTMKGSRITNLRISLRWNTKEQGY